MSTVGLQAIAAGKHVHSEKPLGVSARRGEKLVDAAQAKGVALGSAPDTFLGGAHQTCRKLIDEGAIGTPVAGTAFFMCPGHERWHPNPGFYYHAGRRADARHGALLPDRPRQSARAGGAGRRDDVDAPRATRTITSEPRAGKHDSGRGRRPMSPARWQFVSGAIVTLGMSFDVADAPASADRDLRHRRDARRARPELVRRRRSSWRRPTRTSGRTSRPSCPMPTAIIARSASPTWRMRSARAVRTGRAATWPCMCSR